MIRKNIELTIDEVHIIHNCLNELCNGIDIPEFELRLGFTIDEARKLLERTSRIYREMNNNLKTY